jgi:hypothetical protein
MGSPLRNVDSPWSLGAAHPEAADSYLGTMEAHPGATAMELTMEQRRLTLEL